MQPLQALRLLRGGARFSFSQSGMPSVEASSYDAALDVRCASAKAQITSSTDGGLPPSANLTVVSRTIISLSNCCAESAKPFVDVAESAASGLLGFCRLLASCIAQTRQRGGLQGTRAEALRSRRG